MSSELESILTLANRIANRTPGISGSEFWEAIRAAYERNPQQYTDDILPELMTWASTLDTPPVWMAQEVTDAPHQAQLAPFAWIGYAPKSQNIQELQRDEASSIHYLNLDDFRLAESDIIDALNLSHLAMRSIRISKPCITAPMVKAIADSPHMAQLTRLQLERLNHSDAKPVKGAEHLAKSPHLKALKRLDLSGAEIGLRAAKALLTSPGLAGLTHLDLSQCKLNDKTIALLANSSHMANLISLNINDCGLGLASFQALFDSPHLRLLSLDVSQNHLEALPSLLVQADNMRQLERLNLMWSASDRSTTEALTQPHLLTSLQELHVSGAEKIIERAVSLAGCQPVKLWGWKELTPLQAPHTEHVEVEDNETEEWRQAFGELRSILEANTPEQAQHLWEWIRITSLKHPEHYEQKALPHLEAWNARRPQSTTLHVTDAEILKRIAEFAPFLRVKLEAQNLQTAHLKRKPAAQIVELVLPEPKNARIAVGRLKAIGASKHLTHLASLHTQNNRFGDEGAHALATNPRLTRLEHLVLWYANMTSDGIEAIATSPNFSKLRTLHIMDSAPDDTGTVAIASSPHMANLTSFCAPTGPRSGLEPAAEAIAKSSYMQNLTHLRLGAITGSGMRALLDSPHLAQLTSLKIERVTAQAITALVESPNAARLRHLHLEQCRHTPHALLEIAHSPHLSNLESLDLPYAGLSPESIEAIANSPHLSNLRRLNLSSGIFASNGDQREDIWPAGMHLLANATHLDHLTELLLDQNNLERASIEILASAPFFSRLRRLSIANNSPGQEGYRALAESPHMTQLEALCISHHAIIGRGASERLARSPNLAHCKLVKTMPPAHAVVP